MPKDLRKLMKKNNFLLMKQNGHLHWKHVNGGKVTTSLTPSCRHAMQNIKKDIKNVTGKIIH